MPVPYLALKSYSLPSACGGGRKGTHAGTTPRPTLQPGFWVGKVSKPLGGALAPHLLQTSPPPLLGAPNLGHPHPH